jgi:hypothetical protein
MRQLVSPSAQHFACAHNRVENGLRGAREVMFATDLKRLAEKCRALEARLAALEKVSDS